MERSISTPWAAAVAVLAASCWQPVLPLASAFVSPHTSIITPHLPSPGIKPATVPLGAAATVLSIEDKARKHARFTPAMATRTSAHRSLHYSERASVVSGGASSRTSSAAGSIGSPLLMSTTEVEGTPGTAIIPDELDAKKDLMNQVDLASSSKKR